MVPNGMSAMRRAALRRLSVRYSALSDRERRAMRRFLKRMPVVRAAVECGTDADTAVRSLEALLGMGSMNFRAWDENGRIQWDLIPRGM